MTTPYEVCRENFVFPFHLRPYQIEEVNTLCPFDRSGYYWEPGCVDSETEYLTPTGWARIADYRSGPVAQYTEATGQVDFVEPSAYVKLPCSQMVKIKTTYGIDQVLSPEHRVLSYRADRPKRAPDILQAGEILARHGLFHAGEPSQGFERLGIPTVFTGPESVGTGLSEASLRLQVAVIADGHFGGAGNRCTMRLKRPRKVQRLRQLLGAAGVMYREREQSTPTAQGFTVFTFIAPIRLKEFDSRFWASSRAEMLALADEIPHWDGSSLTGGRGVSFTSTSKASADFVQYVYASQGQTARLSEDSRREKYRGGHCYTVTVRGGSRGGKRGLLSLNSRKHETVTSVDSTDGFKYCFTVPSSFLVLRRAGCVFVTGNSGKTSGSTHQMLYWMLTQDIEQWFVVLPPILIPQWDLWIRSIIDVATGKPLTTTVYAGPPKKRHQLRMDSDFVILSYGVLKNDFERLYDHATRYNLGVLADEATAIKNIESDTHKAVKLMAEGRPLLLLTGTPVNKPLDAYAYIKLIAPQCYRNLRQFERLHIAEKDEWGNVIEWANLELLAENMKIQTSRIIRREVRKELPPVIYTPLRYDIDPQHMKLYRRIADERLVEFENGKEINAISASALRSALQQIIVNWGEFDEDPNRKPAILDIIEEIMEEIGGKKLVIVANFRRTNRYLQATLADKYGAVAIYGDISAPMKQEALRKFISDSFCRIIILHPESAGFGIDGLQNVCSDMLVVEAPTTPTPFQQVVARLDRDGQADVVHVRVAIALGTVQVGMFRDLLEKDELGFIVQGGYKTLRNSIYGE